MMTPTTTYLEYPTHCIVITLLTEDHILCFKYDDRACDFDQFDHSESELCRLAQYMIEPLARFKWGFKPDSEQE